MSSSVAEVPGGVTEGVYSMTPILYVAKDDPRPEIQEFAKKYKDRYKLEPNFAAQLGYTAANTLVVGLEKAGKNLTVDSFITGIESVKDYKDIFGSPPITFAADKHQGSNEFVPGAGREGQVGGSRHRAAQLLSVSGQKRNAPQIAARFSCPR